MADLKISGLRGVLIPARERRVRTTRCGALTHAASAAHELFSCCSASVCICSFSCACTSASTCARSALTCRREA